jgi:hypothetical protein
MLYRREPEGRLVCGFVEYGPKKTVAFTFSQLRKDENIFGLTHAVSQSSLARKSGD